MISFSSVGLKKEEACQAKGDGRRPATKKRALQGQDPHRHPVFREVFSVLPGDLVLAATEEWCPKPPPRIY